MSEGNGAEKAPDAIDAAIQAEAQAQPGLRVEFELMTGRRCVLAVPIGMSDSEWLSLFANVLEIRDRMKAAQPKLELVQALPTRPA